MAGERMINFKLRELDKIQPWGKAPDLSLHWFALTDGDLWLKFGATTIYEYTKDALAHFGKESTTYNDYYLTRFIEDFTELFEDVRENIPESFYSLTRDIKQFYSDAEKWLDIYDTDEDDNSDFYFEKYDKTISWIYERTFDSMHLVGGPDLSFFRRNEKIRTVWETDHVLENGIKLWTAKSGSFEMDYSSFVEEVKAFGKEFFNEMDKQVELAVAEEWGNIKLDKQQLIEEHQKRKKNFYSELRLLEQEPQKKTDWESLEQLIGRMRNEIKNA